MSVLKCLGVIKNYPRFCCGPIDLEIQAHSTVAIFGANGAGKSTLFQMMTGVLDCDEGKIEFLDQVLAPQHIYLRRQMGYLAQDNPLPRWVSGRDLIKYAMALHQSNLDERDQKLRQLVSTFELQDHLVKAVGSYSYGLAKRLGLCLALMHQPAFLVLDEPFSGLDIRHVANLRAILESRNQQGMATVISTHIPSTVANLCDQAYLMDNGKLSPIESWSLSSAAERIQSVERSFQAYIN